MNRKTEAKEKEIITIEKVKGIDEEISILVLNWEGTIKIRGKEYALNKLKNLVKAKGELEAKINHEWEGAVCINLCSSDIFPIEYNHCGYCGLKTVWINPNGNILPIYNDLIEDLVRDILEWEE